MRVDGDNQTQVNEELAVMIQKRAREWHREIHIGTAVIQLTEEWFEWSMGSWLVAVH